MRYRILSLLLLITLFYIRGSSLGSGKIKRNRSGQHQGNRRRHPSDHAGNGLHYQYKR